MAMKNIDLPYVVQTIIFLLLLAPLSDRMETPQPKTKTPKFFSWISLSLTHGYDWKIWAQMGEIFFGFALLNPVELWGENQTENGLDLAWIGSRFLKAWSWNFFCRKMERKKT